MVVGCKINMAGIFDYFNEPQLARAQSAKEETVIDAPLLLGVKRLQDRYHKKATKSTAMDISVTSPDFKKLMKRFGKKQQHTISGKPISILVTNTAKRTASAEEVSRGFGKFIYYGKFVEFGFHYNTADGGTVFREGARLFAANKTQVAKIITSEIKSIPDKYNRDDLYAAMAAAGVEVGKLFTSKSPRGNNNRWGGEDKRTITKFHESWAVKVIDSATEEDRVVYGRYLEGQ